MLLVVSKMGVIRMYGIKITFSIKIFGKISSFFFIYICSIQCFCIGKELMRFYKLSKKIRILLIPTWNFVWIYVQRANVDCKLMSFFMNIFFFFCYFFVYWSHDFVILFVLLLSVSFSFWSFYFRFFFIIFLNSVFQLSFVLNASWD